MPSYQDHLLFGSIAVLVFAYLAGPVLAYTPGAIIASAAFILLAAVFPDIDHRGSIIYRMTRAFAAVVTGGTALLAAPDPVWMVAAAGSAGGTVMLLFNRLKPRHRTVTHTYRAAVGFTAVTGAFTLLLFDTFLPAVFAFLA
ncbi:MAG: metal-dependent hydrolase, partial [Candidatus Nanohaloarchaea archaeon]